MSEKAGTIYGVIIRSEIHTPKNSGRVKTTIEIESTLKADVDEALREIITGQATEGYTLLGVELTTRDADSEVTA